MIQQFKTAYAMHIWLKCLTWLGLISVATLLLRISDGFPPQVWYLLAQAAPHIGSLLAARGIIALASFAGIVFLSLTWGILWLLLLWVSIALIWPSRPKRRMQAAINWQRTSADNLLDQGFDEPQASLAYAALATTPSPLRTEDVGVGWDPGIVRKHKPNEDAVLVQRSVCTAYGRLVPLSLFVVADGMGGHASGQVASHLATHSMMQTVLPTIQNGEELTEEFLIDTLV